MREPYSFDAREASVGDRAQSQPYVNYFETIVSK